MLESGKSQFRGEFYVDLLTARTLSARRARDGEDGDKLEEGTR